MLEYIESHLFHSFRTYTHMVIIFMQDSDPKHTSRLVQGVLTKEGINWWKTPAESPDCNPIENLWHEYIQREVKPFCKGNVVEGIYKFWERVTTEKWQKIHSAPQISPSQNHRSGWRLLIRLQSGESSGGFHYSILSSV